MFQEIIKLPKEILNLRLVSIYFQSLYKTPVSTASVNIPRQKSEGHTDIMHPSPTSLTQIMSHLLLRAQQL